MHFNRRSLLGYSFWSAGAMLAGRSAAEGAEPLYAGDKNDDWVIDDTSAVADTESGKVMGYVRNGIRIFKGIPYGEVLSPEGRWVRAAKVRPWGGKRSSRAFGPICPAPDIMPAVDEAALAYSDLVLTRASEDCL